MDCKSFGKRLNELLEGNLPYDIEKAMEKHIEECEACRKIYENEISIDKMLYKSMLAEDTAFTSIRSGIIDSIDEKRYKKNIFNRLYYRLKLHGKRYVAAAALTAFLCVTITQIVNGAVGFPFIMNGNTQSVKKNEVMNYKHGIGTNTSDSKSSFSPYVPSSGFVLPEFVKQTANADSITVDSDNWKQSPDGSISAVIIGKGENAQEEGIASILLKDRSGGESLLKLTANNRQFTPKSIEWKDNENLYVIVGYGYGMVTTGGDLFILNTKTLKVTPLYIGEKCKREVSSLKILDTGIQLSVNIYNADATSYTTETVTIDNSQIN